MKTPPRIEQAHIEPQCKGGIPQSIQTTAKRFKRLKELARLLNVRRCAEGSPSVGALVDAIYHGKIVLKRRDDPQEREFWVGMEDKPPQLAADPRCPDDWKD